MFFQGFRPETYWKHVVITPKNTSWIYPQTFICSWHPGWGVYLRHKSFLTQLWLGKCPMCLAFVPLRLCALPFDQSIEKNPSRFGFAKFYWHNYTAGLFQFHVSSSSGVKIQIIGELSMCRHIKSQNIRENHILRRSGFNSTQPVWKALVKMEKIFPSFGQENSNTWTLTSVRFIPSPCHPHKKSYNCSARHLFVSVPIESHWGFPGWWSGARQSYSLAGQEQKSPAIVLERCFPCKSSSRG